MRRLLTLLKNCTWKIAQSYQTTRRSCGFESCEKLSLFPTQRGLPVFLVFSWVPDQRAFKKQLDLHMYLYGLFGQFVPFRSLNACIQFSEPKSWSCFLQGWLIGNQCASWPEYQSVTVYFHFSLGYPNMDHL